MSRWRVGLGASPGCPQPNAGLEDGGLTAPLNRGQSDVDNPTAKAGGFLEPCIMVFGPPRAFLPGPRRPGFTRAYR